MDSHLFQIPAETEWCLENNPKAQYGGSTTQSKNVEQWEKSRPGRFKKYPPRTIISGPVKTEEELVVISSPIEEKSLPGNRLLLTNIQGGDYGRIVGSGGSNIYRIETEYEIVVSTRG